MATRPLSSPHRLRPMAGQESASSSSLERLDYGANPNEIPIVSIIVPTLDRHRRGLLDRLMSDLEQQTLARFELILVIGDRRQGRAINRGVDAARASIVVTMDDDTLIGTPNLLESLVGVLEDPGIGMVGASTVLPPNAGWFQRIASKQIPRRLFPLVHRIVDSDMVQHPCLAMRKEVFLEIGGEDEELKRGLDPLLRHKVREAGYRVVIAPQTWIIHPLPDSYTAVVRMYFRNGRGSAFAQRQYPDRVYNLSDGFRNNQFPARVPFLIRAGSYPLRLFKALVTLKWIHLSVQFAYIGGYLAEYLFPVYSRESGASTGTACR